MADEPVRFPTITKPARDAAFNFRQRVSALFPTAPQMMVFVCMTGYDSARIIGWCDASIVIPQHAWTILALLESMKERGVPWPRSIVE